MPYRAQVDDYRSKALRIAGLAVLYALAARLGLLLDPVGGFATVVWAPTGIAIAALLTFGPWIAPGVFLGAFAANALSGAPAMVAATIGVGNTLEAIVAFAMLRRWRAFDAELSTLAAVLAFLVVAAVAPVVSATIGVGAIAFAGIVSRGEIAFAWRTWWLGDFIGALLVAPVALVWRGARPSAPSRARFIEGLALTATIVLITAPIFFLPAPVEHDLLEAYLLFPPLIWAAVRFEQRGATAAVLLTSIVAIAGTARGGGPFHDAQLRDSLLALQTFMGIVAISFLVLATAVAERTRARAALARAFESEAAANRSKSDFIAVMSHELRTPLNAIAGYAQLMAMGVHGTLTDGQRDAVKRIQRNQEHLATLVNDVLSFSRVEAGRMAVRATPVPVGDAIESLRAFIDPDLKRKHIRLDVEEVADDLAVLADPEKLRQILLNLVGNAMKYTDAGGHVSISARAAEDRVVISIQDTGIGIPGDQLERVFEPFFQVERGHTRRFAGVGLGLTISRDLARAMEGEISIESAHGRGTVARVSLPRAQR